MKKLLSGIIGLLFCSSALAQSDFGIVYGPYLQGVTSDEATVVWVTSGEAVSWVEIAPDDGSHFYAEQRPQFFDSKFGRKQIGTLHKVRIHGLENATSYRYRIYSREVVSQQPYFIGYGKTAASNVYSRKP